MPVSFLELRGRELAGMRLEGPALEVLRKGEGARLFPVRHLKQLVFHGAAEQWLLVLSQLALRGTTVTVFDDGETKLLLCPAKPSRPLLADTLKHWEAGAEESLDDWVLDQARHLLSRRLEARLLYEAAQARQPAWLAARAQAALVAGLLRYGMVPDSALLMRVAKKMVPLLLLEAYPDDCPSLRQQAAWCWRYDLNARVEKWCERLLYASWHGQWHTRSRK